MMRQLLFLAVFLAVLLSLPSCSALNRVKLPRSDVAAVAAAITRAFATTQDLDLDGTVNGVDEWEAFLRAWHQAYQERERAK